MTCSLCLSSKPGIEIPAPNPETEAVWAWPFSAGPKGSVKWFPGPPGLEHQVISSLLWKTCHISHSALPRKAQRREEARGCTAQPPQPPSVACPSSATASSSFLTKVFLDHRQQTQSSCSSVSHYVTDLLPKFWSFTKLTIEFICSVENGAVLPATLRWNSWKSCGRISWLRAWGWDGRAAQPQHTLLADQEGAVMELLLPPLLLPKI